MGIPRLKNKEYLKLILDTIPVAIIVVDEELFVLDSNRAALDLILINREVRPPVLCGNAMGCINAITSGGGCGSTEFCKECVVRNSILEAFSGRPVTRRYGVIMQEREGDWKDVHLMVSVSVIELDGKSLALVTLEDVTELYELSEIIPICSSCNKVRTDKGYWEKVESYLQRHKGMKFSHGICPDCKKRLYSELDK